MYFYKKNKNVLLIIILLTLISRLITKQININLNQFNEFSQNKFNEEKNNFFRYLDSGICSSVSYSKSDIQEECNKGPNSYDKYLKYNTFYGYINMHDYHSNGLNYVTSLLVDDDTHHFGNFMNDGAGIIILMIIGGLIMLSWIPLLCCCWKNKCLIFGECLYDDEDSSCCTIFWNIFTLFFSLAIFSFIIVVLCFGK